ncbi:MAG: hypothetical protein P8Y11_07455, partial [Gemmatimonadales bacterium]
MIRIRCFGGISVEGTDGATIHFRSRKHVALLTFLAANPDRRTVGALDGDSPKTTDADHLNGSIPGR